jgi:hypothetical protein
MTKKQPVPLLAAGVLLAVVAGLLCCGATTADPTELPLTAGA